MKLTHFMLLLLLVSAFTGGCKKENVSGSSTVFVKLFQSDTSYQTGGAFQLPDGNYIIYGFPPEDNRDSPIIIKVDPHGSIIWKKRLPGDFHYCTVKPDPSSPNTLIAVGTAENSTPNSTIQVCKIDLLRNISLPKAYPVLHLKSGPLLPPKFEVDPLTGELFVAGTIDDNGHVFPFVLDVSPDGTVATYHQFDSLIDSSLMTRGFCRDLDGFTITGSTYIGAIAASSDAVSFCLRLKTNFETNWSKIFTNPAGSISSTGISETNSTIILYGSQATVATQNSEVTDLPGILYSHQIGLSGTPEKEDIYATSENLAHAAAMSNTSDGFILAATTNALSDLHLVTGTYIYLLKLRFDGEGSLVEQWHQQFNGFNAFTAVSVVQASDGGYLVSGYEHSSTFHYTMILIKTDVNGNIISL
ncbi:MAG TPA: hypothetical protein VE978_18910 [Chitinophagales bacterium]|nr:hypothetical protein [Chitinophagales bacterium]